MKKHDREALANIIDLIAVQAEEMYTTKLSKADPGEETPGEKKPEGSSVEGTQDGPPPSSPKDDASSAPPPPDVSASAPPPGGDDGSAPPAPPAGGDAPGGEMPMGDDGGGEMNPEAIKQQIMHLPMEMVQMYYLAFADRLRELAPGGDAGASAGAPPAPAPEATPPAPPAAPPGPPGGDLPMGKGEFDDQSGKIMKSLNELKSELSAQKALTENLQGIVANQTTMLLKSASRPVRMSVSAVDLGASLVKTEKKDASGLSRDEIVKRLSKVTAKPDLSKSDRDLSKQYMRGECGVDKIAHLVIE